MRLFKSRESAFWNHDRKLSVHEETELFRTFRDLGEAAPLHQRVHSVGDLTNTVRPNL